MQMHEFEIFVREILSTEIQKLKNSEKEIPDELMSMDDVREFLKVSKVTIHKWKKMKLIQSHRIGRKIYFKKNEILNSMNSFTIKNKKHD